MILTENVRKGVGCGKRFQVRMPECPSIPVSLQCHYMVSPWPVKGQLSIIHASMLLILPTTERNF